MSESIDWLKNQLYGFLYADPENAYSMDELAEEFHVERWLIQKALSQLQDERKIIFRVLQKKVYAHVRR